MQLTIQKGGIGIRKSLMRQLEKGWYSKKGECVFCGEEKSLCDNICKSCLEDRYTDVCGVNFVSYQTKLIKKIMNYNLKKELSQIYYEKYKKKFCITDEDARIFLKEYCLEDKECFSRYILKNS